MKLITRIAIAIAALFFGAFFVYGLTYLGDKSKGPVGDFFSKAADAVHGTEEKYILKKRVKKRSQNLEWLNKDLATLRNPNKILTGAFDNMAVNSYKPIFELEDSFHTVFPLIHLYTAWGSKKNQIFPRLEVESILKTGSIPVVTWEPWLSDFDSEILPGLRPKETRDLNGLKDITNGVYDSYIRTWAKAAAKMGKPLFLRLGHEMNDPYRYPWGPQNNHPDDFIAAWRHVRFIFSAEKAENVLWIWSPHPAHGRFVEYYPGDEYVDYVGVGILNYGKVAHWSDWWTFDQIFGQHYPALTAFGKPIMITEFGCLAVGGSRSQWYYDALSSIPQKYPQVKSVLFFHFSEDNTTTQETLNWYVKYDTATINAMVKGMRHWK